MTPPVTISPEVRSDIRRTHAELKEARAAADRVDRPDGTDETGHPGIRAANLEGYLGRYALPLLEALESAEGLTRVEEPVRIAGVPASMYARAVVFIEGLEEPVELPLKLSAHQGYIVMTVDPRPAIAAVDAAASNATLDAMQS